MKKISILFYLIFLSITSCKQGVNITIENNGYNLIDSLKIESDFINIKHYSLKKGEKFEVFVSSYENNKKDDGVFLLKLYFNNKLKRFYFGYYSNGILPYNDLFVKIQNDSIYVSKKK